MSQQRTTPTFTSLSITGKAIDAYLSVGGPISVRVSSDDNIVPLISTAVQKDQLVIGLDRVVSTKLGMRVDLSVPSLVQVKAGPAVKVHLTGVAADRLAIEGGVGSQITGSGQTSRMSLSLVGGARADLRALEARDAEVSLRGTSTAEILATNSVTGEAREMSHLGVWGQSPSVAVRAGDASTVTMMGMPITSS